MAPNTIENYVGHADAMPCLDWDYILDLRRRDWKQSVVKPHKKVAWIAEMVSSFKSLKVFQAVYGKL